MLDVKIIPIILSGGSGTRLWPLSRELYPKQLLAFNQSSQTMLQTTAARLEGLNVIAPVVVCNEHHRFMVAEQLLEIGIGDASIMLEPIGRNTAPAIAVAAMEVIERDGDGVVLVLPADHLIRNVNAFQQSVRAGLDYACQDKLVTFGIVPTEPHTGYGYIQAGEHLAEQGYRVSRFVEKPDNSTAQQYLQDGDYYWNSGMFLFKASVYLQELQQQRPDIFQAAEMAYQKRRVDYDFIRLDEDAFTSSPSDSIDYAVMEKTENAVVVPMDAGWNDIGSWSALWDVGEKDQHGNVVNGDVYTSDVSNTYLHANNRLIAAVGVKDYIVVETTDAVLVAHRDKVQDVKNIVEQLKSLQREETLLHRKVYRPWGSYECIDEDARFKVKRIIVNPGASLSMQMHHHRAEHWVVVKGTAKVTRGEDTFMLAENESTFIPVGTMHRLENFGKIPLEIVEVQSGSYLGEDDIVRFDDNYGREDK